MTGARTRAVALAALTAVLFVASTAAQLRVDGPGRPAGEVIVAGLLYAVGTLLTIRRPQHLLGWLFAVSALGVVVLGIGQPPAWMPTPVTWAWAWVGSWAWFVASGLPATFALLHFPDGRLPSPGWRWMRRGLLVCFAVAIAAVTVLPYDVAGVAAPFDNPLALPGAAALAELVLSAALLGILAGVFACAASLVVRFRGSSGPLRQQLKVVAFGAALGVSTIPVIYAVEAAFDVVLVHHVYAAVIGLPVLAIGVAISRYRLYDLDRLISRTLAYAVVTVALVALYAGGVLGLGSILRGLGGSGDLAVAASTLLVAAAFHPMRRRVQAAVDRRFNRARYDAERTVEAFRDRLRGDVALGEVTGDLLDAVTATVQPAGAVVWLRPGAEASP